jgi:two-component system, LytTR family, response regulator
VSEPVRVMIVDDEPLARQAIRQLLDGDPEVAIVAESAGVDGVELVERAAPDLIFLDVQMPEVDGFELLERVGVAGAPVVIFVTAYSEHALRAFDAHALDYVLKPVAGERFARALARGKELVRLRRAGGEPPADPRLATLLRARSRETRRIFVRDRGSVRVIDVDTIDWIEAADYYAVIHALGASHLLRETMTELAQRLDPARFFRVHRSAIVPLDRVREIHPLVRGDRELVLAGGARVRLSRARRAEFEARLAAAARAPARGDAPR